MNPKTSSKKDYFKLPFEVYFEGPLEFKNYGFKSNISPKRFKDVKAVRLEEGQATGVTFACYKNSGPELYCCMTGGHDEVDPDWLEFIDEEDVNYQYETHFAVEVNGKEIKFAVNEYKDFSDMDYCCTYGMTKYHLDGIRPDYIILDAKKSRIMINAEGYRLDENHLPIMTERVISLSEEDEGKYSDYSFCELWDAKSKWVQDTLEKDFPKEKDLRLAWETD